MKRTPSFHTDVSEANRCSPPAPLELNQCATYKKRLELAVNLSGPRDHGFLTVTCETV